MSHTDGRAELFDHAAAQRVLDDSPFGPWWGFVVDGVDTSGTASVVLHARPEHYRPGGVLQGGCLVTLADVAFWLALLARFPSDSRAVTLEMKTNFLRAATGDVTAHAQLLKTGSRVVFGTVTSHGKGGEIVAHHTVTYLRGS
jgi:uncharacterized protein (TIGR00369 family)